MSAFVCSPSHIGLLAAYAVKTSSVIHVWREPTWLETAQQVAKELARENIRSVAARYPNDKDGERPGPCLKDDDILDASACYAAHYLDNWDTPEPVQILSMCQCFDYQACETEDWRATKAHQQINWIKSAAIRCLPGYDAAPWDFSEHIEAIDSLFYDPT